jgi:hypothetical protein
LKIEYIAISASAGKSIVCRDGLDAILHASHDSQRT